MTEQQYRAEQCINTEPHEPHTFRGQYRGVYITETFQCNGIERPVPTTDEHVDGNMLNLGYYRTKVECSCGGSWWFGGHEGDPTYDEAKAQHVRPAPPPTRDQIAEVMQRADQTARWGENRYEVQADAVLALLQKGGER